MIDPMAAQMAQLLDGSDLEELREIVARWVADAPSAGMREHYRRFGAKLIELKQHFAALPVQPTREELEAALTMMLKMAAATGGQR
jgi:urease accessory protein UreF